MSFGAKTREINRLRSENRQLREQNEKVTKGIAGAKNALGSATRAAGMIDSAQVKELKHDLAAANTRIAVLEAEAGKREADIAALADRAESAVAAVEDHFAGTEWETGPESMGVLLRRANERADALAQRLAVLQAANEAADRHSGAEPWIGEKTRAEAAS